MKSLDELKRITYDSIVQEYNEALEKEQTKLEDLNLEKFRYILLLDIGAIEETSIINKKDIDAFMNKFPSKESEIKREIRKYEALLCNLEDIKRHYVK